MKKILIYISLACVVLVTTTATQVPQGECDFRALKNELLISLKPDFKYCSSKINRFKYTEKEQSVEIEAPLLPGQQFKFLFNTAGLPKGVDITILDKPGRSGKKIFSLKEVFQEGKTVYSFEPASTSSVVIKYTLPGIKDKDVYGCLVSVLGYKIKAN